MAHVNEPTGLLSLNTLGRIEARVL